mmetsp:Transcript_45463/g.125496  ORF Transcript_45463/g.125496 Transcript_45463/m.125496 type:complete len:319 (+) Transcript_45463:522-1478(+)
MWFGHRAVLCTLCPGTMITFPNIRPTAPPTNTTTTTTTHVPANQYTEIGGADSSWNNWMSGDPCDDYWYGITTSDDSVTQVALTGMSSATSAATLPTQLGYLTDLKTGLELSSNSFVGTIPTQFGKLTNMQSCGKACFYNNELTGTLPSQLGQWTKLTAADGLFAENSITGTVPSELGKWAELDSCGKGCLSDNQISGTIPTQLGQWGRNFSAGFAFDNNKMTGSLPTQIGYLTSMTSELLLEGNCECVYPYFAKRVTTYFAKHIQAHEARPTLGKLPRKDGPNRAFVTRPPFATPDQTAPRPFILYTPYPTPSDAQS